MNGTQRTKTPWLVGGATLVLLGSLLVTMVGGVSAAPVGPAASSSTLWAYGGSNSTNGTISLPGETISWNTSFSVVVVLNSTATGPNTTELSLQRTVAISVTGSVTLTNGSYGAVSYKGLEVDNAYANLTNASTVYVLGAPVAALGLDNSSVAAHASVAESAVGKIGNRSAFAYFNASGALASSVQFAPSFGLVPLNLTGVSAWNSTTTASPKAAWNFSYDYNFLGWQGTTGGGSGSASGNWSGTYELALSGEVVTVSIPRFSDHVNRTAIVLGVTGGADLYDGVIVIPHGFDLFGGATMPFVAHTGGLGAATISSDELFLVRGHVRPASFTASEVTFGASGTIGMLSGSGSMAPAASDASGTVVAQPESVSAAQQQAHCLQFGCSSAGPWFGGAVALAVVGALVAAVVGTVGVIEWKSYARRKNSSTQLVGGYAAGLANGVPPAALAPPTAQPPANGPETPSGPGRQS
ncbi:MAG TPA: hypothetical protein VMG36_02650 [Thermoplasmata archaeon]|nr:hypothetical protein [Thermoplasmata archaeon]